MMKKIWNYKLKSFVKVEVSQENYKGLQRYCCILNHKTAFVKILLRKYRISTNLLYQDKKLYTLRKYYFG